MRRIKAEIRLLFLFLVGFSLLGWALVQLLGA